MRMRKKKHGAERISACADYIIEPKEEGFTDLSSYFEKNQPIHLEIGCGKGDFAIGMAKKYPEYNFVALERVADVACIALEKAKAQEVPNLKFIIGNAQKVTDWIAPHTIDTLYLNFSDPWPKKGYAKRRLTHIGFLEQYRIILKEGGLLRFKTDNEGLFDFSLEQFEEAKLQMLFCTRDLHNSEKAPDNVMTEYERNFTEKGQVIYSAWVKF